MTDTEARLTAAGASPAIARMCAEAAQAVGEAIARGAAIPRARRTDPATSHAAASSSVEFLTDHQRIVLECLKQHGPLGKTGVSRLTVLNDVQACRRFNELERAGLIAETGRTVRSASGRAEREMGAV